MRINLIVLWLQQTTLPLPNLLLFIPSLRGERKRIALVGLPGAGKSTIFDSVASTVPQSGALIGNPLYPTMRVKCKLG